MVAVAASSPAQARVVAGLPTYRLNLMRVGYLLMGVGLIVAPLVVFFRDLERAVKLVLRFLFYASPIVYASADLPEGFHFWAAFNPLSGIFGLYRSAFFPGQLDWLDAGCSRAAACGVPADRVVNTWSVERLLDRTR